MNKAIIIATTIASIFIIFFIGNALTGFIVMDDNTKELCQTNKDCSKGGEVCCLFDAEDAGVCDSMSRCDAITQATRAKEPILQRPANMNSPSRVIFAGTIFLLAMSLATAISFYKIKHEVIKKKDGRGDEKTKISSSKDRKSDAKKSGKISGKISLYDRIFPIRIRFEEDKIGKYIVLTVIIIALVAILILIC